MLTMINIFMDSSKCPLLEPFKNNGRRLRFFTSQQAVCVAVGEGAGPIMRNIGVVVMNDYIVPAMPRHPFISTAQIRRRIRGDFEAVALSPVIDVGHDVCGIRVTACVDSAFIWNGSVGIPMELHERHRLPTGVAR